MWGAGNRLKRLGGGTSGGNARFRTAHFVSYLLGLLLWLFGCGPPAPAAEAATGTSAVSIPIDERSDGPPLPAVTPARGDDPPLVVIDAGHGGRDPGAPGALEGLEEKAVTLGLARAIRDELAASGRVRVALTRDSDLFLPLEQRSAIARRLDADLFISIHADAAQANPDARGATIYTLSEVASDAEAALLAGRENAVDAVGGVAMSGDAGVNLILIDLAQRESMEVSAGFARLLHREASSLFDFQRDWRRFAAFIVLKAADVPSILFEAGYVSNPDDARYLASAEGRRDIAAGMRRAIEAHFARRFLDES
jgi:N-acetylmuramoyl-L-alanine amidase